MANDNRERDTKDVEATQRFRPTKEKEKEKGCERGAFQRRKLKRKRKRVRFADDIDDGGIRKKQRIMEHVIHAERVDRVMGANAMAAERMKKGSSGKLKKGSKTSSSQAVAPGGVAKDEDVSLNTLIMMAMYRELRNGNRKKVGQGRKTNASFWLWVQGLRLGRLGKEGALAEHSTQQSASSTNYFCYLVWFLASCGVLLRLIQRTPQASEHSYPNQRGCQSGPKHCGETTPS